MWMCESQSPLCSFCVRFAQPFTAPTHSADALFRGPSPAQAQAEHSKRRNKKLNEVQERMLFLSFLILGFLLLEIEPLKVLPSISKTIVPPTRRLQTSVINVPVVSASFLLQSSAVSWRWKSLILFNAKIENIVSNNPRDDGDDNEEESCRFCDCIRHHYQQFIDQLPLSPSLHQRLQLPLQLPVISSLIEYQQEKRKQRRAQQRLSGQRPPDEDCKVPTSSQQDTCNDHDNTQMQNSTAHDHLVIQALKWFKNTYHHLHIPIEFTIPENATDPFTGSPVHPMFAKLPLGNITERYRNNGVNGRIFRQQLIDIGLLPPTSKVCIYFMYILNDANLMLFLSFGCCL